MTLHQKIWMPDARPLMPSASDDEFDGTVAEFDSRWHKADPDARYTHSLANGRLTITGTGAAGNTNRWVRFSQPVPASEYAIYAKLSCEVPNAGFSGAGIFLAQDLVADPINADSHHIGIEYNVGGSGIVHRLWTSYSAFSSTTSVGQPPASDIYLRIRANGTFSTGDFSFDGVSWVQVNGVTFAATRIGLGCNINNSLTGWWHWEYFRCIAGPGTSQFNGTRLGREVDLLMAA